MPLPEDVSTRQVHDRRLTLLGDPRAGHVRFIPTADRLIHAETSTTITGTVVRADYDADGELLVTLPCTNDEDLTGGPFSYLVEINLLEPGSIRPETPFAFYIDLPPGEEPLELSDVTPILPASGGSNLVFSVNGESGHVTLSPADIGAEVSGAAASAVAAHVGASDPHPQYLTAAEGTAAYVPRTGGTLTGPVTIAAVTGAAALTDLPLGRTGAANTGLNLIGSFAGGEDESGGTDFDSTARINRFVYQRAEDGSYGEVDRTFLMRADAKGTFAWYKPQSGYNLTTMEPVGSTWQPMAWLVGHVVSNDDPTSLHNHLSIEIPDSTGAVQTRLEFPWGPQGVGVDQTIRGLDHINIKTNLADFTIRADGSTGYGGGRVGILRVAGANANEKILEFGLGAETGATSLIRWRFVNNATTESGSNVGSDFAIRRHADNGTLGGTAIFIKRSSGNIALGQASAENARMAAVWSTTDDHGFLAKPSSDPGNGAAYAAVMSTSTNRLFDGRVTGDSIARLLMLVTGEIQLGPGNASRDVFIARTAAGVLGVTGSLQLTTAGNGIGIKEGTNATMGTATLVAGTVTVNTTKVTANSRIFLTGQNASGTHGELGISARTAGTSFTITSSSAADTRAVAWWIVEPA